MHNWAKDLFPICRSITGPGLRETLKYIKNIDDSRHLIGIDRGSEVEGSVLNATIGAPRTYGVNFGINF